MKNISFYEKDINGDFMEVEYSEITERQRHYCMVKYKELHCSWCFLPLLEKFYPWFGDAVTKNKEAIDNYPNLYIIGDTKDTREGRVLEVDFDNLRKETTSEMNNLGEMIDYMISESLICDSDDIKRAFNKVASLVNTSNHCGLKNVFTELDTRVKKL